MTAAPAQRSTVQQAALDRLMGLAVFGEKLAAATYRRMAELCPDEAETLLRFASMEGRHAADFAAFSAQQCIEPDGDFSDASLGYLREQVEAYVAAEDFDALAVLQGFLVESLAIATYGPFLEVADDYPGAPALFSRILDEEREHVAWIERYLRRRFAGDRDGFTALAARVNQRGIDCVGGSLLRIADSLDAIGMSGSDCAAAMVDGYGQLLARVGIDEEEATRSVLQLFLPLLRAYRAERAPSPQTPQ